MYSNHVSISHRPKMTLKVTRSNVHHMCTISIHESLISHHFALRSLVFQIIDIYGFSIAYNGEFEILEKKNVKIGNSKFQIFQTSFWEDQWQENSGQVWKPSASIL